MTPQQREAALRLADWLHASGVVNSEVKETIALLRELLAEPQGEPVAWCSLTPSGKIAYFDGKPMVMPGAVGNEVHRTPLYAHPPQQRRPLSADQIRDAVNDPAFWATSKNFIFRIARAIECAHGITGEPT